MQENEFPSEFISMIKEMENEGKTGFDRKTQRWKPHKSPEGGLKTIGYGHKLKLGETHLANVPQTNTEIEQLLMKDLVNHSRLVKDAYNKYIRTTYESQDQNLFDSLDQKMKLLLIEKFYNGGTIDGWPKMLKHIHDKNPEAALIEARGKWRRKGEAPQWDTRRNNIRENYFKKENTNVGGVDLHVNNEMLLSIDQQLSKCGIIVGISFNESRNSLVLLTATDENNNNPLITVKGVSLEHLAVGLLIVYSTSNQYEPSFSLDPWEATNPNGPYMRKVYYPDEFLHEQLLQGTTFGEIMFEADWILKQLSLGLEVEQIEPILKTKPMVYPDHLRNTYGVKPISVGDQNIKNRWYRLWIVNEVILSTQSNIESQKITSGSCLIFGDIKMNVKAKCMIISSQNGQLQDACDDDDQQTEAYRFADAVGKNYDNVANHFPILNQLKELTKCVALAKWLYLHNVPIDMILLKDFVDKNRRIYPNKIPSLTHTTKTTVGNTIHTQTVFGGVTLKLSIDPSVINSRVYNDIQQQLDQRKMIINLNSSVSKALPIPLPFNYVKRKVCDVCQSTLSWKELQLWQMALHPNYAQIVENSNLTSNHSRCLLHNPLVCKECLEPIVDSRPFIQDQTGCHHVDCRVCYECQKPLVGSYILLNDLSYHQECIDQAQSLASYSRNTTDNLDDDDLQEAIQRSLEEERKTVTTVTDLEALELVKAISLSMEDMESSRFKHSSRPPIMSNDYEEQRALLVDFNLNPVLPVRNRTCIVCTYDNRHNAKKCEMCDNILQ